MATSLILVVTNVKFSSTILPNNTKPFSSTEKPLTGKCGSCPEPNEYCIPTKAMTREDMDQTCLEYAHAAKCAIAAGFDGVEIHGMPKTFYIMVLIVMLKKSNC